MTVFEKRINQLVCFQQYYGIKTPSRKDPNPAIASLGRWAHRTRRNQRQGKLKLNHYYALIGIGFEFEQNSRSLSMPIELRETYNEILSNINNGKAIPNSYINHYTYLVRAEEHGFLLPEHEQVLKKTIQPYLRTYAA